MSTFWEKEFGKFKHDFEPVQDLPFTIAPYCAVLAHRNLNLDVAGKVKRAGLIVISFPQYMLSLGLADVIVDQKVVNDFLQTEYDILTNLTNFHVDGFPLATTVLVHMTNVVPRDLNETYKKAVKCVNWGSGKGLVHIAYPAPMIVGKVVETLNNLTGYRYVRFAPTLQDALKIWAKFVEPLTVKPQA